MSARKTIEQAFDEYVDTVTKAGGDVTDCCMESYEAGWQAAQQGVPDGWRLVPVDATKEMLDAYKEASVAPIGPLSVRGYWAMLDAAPQPPQEGE